MESIVVDYLRPRVVGKAGYYAGLAALYILSFATFAGLIYLNYSQMPPTRAIKKLWTEIWTLRHAQLVLPIRKNV